MALGRGRRALLGASLAALLGQGCTGDKAPPASSPGQPPAPSGSTPAALTGAPFLVKDLRPGTVEDNFYDPPQMFAELGTTLLFGATDDVHGRELWRSDGTAAGTTMVADLVPGFEGSGPSHPAVLNGKLYFFGGTGSFGPSALWSTDGTLQGTTLVKRLPSPAFLQQHQDALYLGTVDLTTSAGFALWRSDGTPDGTVLLKAVQADTGYIGVMDSAWLGDTLLFTGADDAHGRSLWKSDGTPEGTTLLKDTYPGPDGLFVGGLTPCGSQALFWAESDFYKLSLWRTDGTGQGTFPLKAIDTQDPSNPPPYSLSRLVCYGNTVYFSAWDAEAGQELWKSDGTADGTVRLADLVPGTEGSAPYNLRVQGGSLYFSAREPTTGAELWKSDGTAQGTARLTDLAPGTESGVIEGPRTTLAGPNALFFLATNGTQRGVWKTDGTPAGTVAMSTSSSLQFFDDDFLGTWAANALYFWSADDSLWRSTGTAAGTKKVTALANRMAGGLGSRLPGVDLNGTLFFTADDGEFEKLWKSDGTAAGTGVVQGPLSSVGVMARLNGRLVLVAYGNSEMAVWSVETAAQAPRKLASVAYWNEQTPQLVTGSKRAFFADNGGFFQGDSLWTTDGTPEGTLLLKRLLPQDGQEWHPKHLTSVGDRLFFVTSATFKHEELWTSDGTVAGTRRVTDLDAPEKAVSFHRLFAVNGRLLLWATTSTGGLELWTSDGTPEGTRALGSFPSPARENPGSVKQAVVGGTLFYVVDPSGNAPPELWKSNGEAPVKVRTFGTSGRVSAPDQLTAFGDTLLLWADDGVTGLEPWHSDGTEAGTVPVKDIAPGPRGAVGSPGPFTLLGPTGPVVFAASDVETGLEPWQTNGTAEGTKRVVDLVPGVGSSAPGWMTVSGSRLFFPAWSPSSGRELWALPLSAPDTTPPVLTCPQPQVAEAVNAQGAPVSWTPATVTDADPKPVVQYSRVSGDTFPLGTTSVTVTAVDEAGNRSTCAFDVTVRDTQAPALECPPSQSAVATSAAGVAVEWPEAQASDAVSTPTVVYAPAWGSVFALGTTEVKATAADASGNSRSCTFEVRVQAASTDGGSTGTPDGGTGTPDGGNPGTPDGGGTGTPDGGSTGTPDGGGTGTDTPAPTPDTSGCGCQQSGGAGTALFGLAMLALLSAPRRRRARLGVSSR